MTTNEIKAGLRIMVAVTEAVRDAGRIGEGLVYAALSSVVTLPAFESLVQQLVGTGLIRREAPNMLVWAGPVN